jgi:O-antigen biosynthesis protein
MKHEGLIILLVRNNVALSRECLKSLRVQTHPCVILVVDNASTDGTKQWLRAEKDIRVLSFSEQQSVSHCWNEALRWGWSQGFDEALVVNNDLVLLPETYETLSSWAAADDGRTTGMVTCVSRREMSELTYTKPFTSRYSPDYSCYLIQRWAHERVPFDERCLIGFCEDSMHHATCHLKGIRCECISLPFLHHGSQTIKRADEIEKRRIGRQADKNRELFYETFGRRIGTSGYDDLFSEERFGMYEAVTGRAKPL